MAAVPRGLRTAMQHASFGNISLQLRICCSSATADLFLAEHLESGVDRLVAAAGRFDRVLVSCFILCAVLYIIVLAPAEKLELSVAHVLFASCTVQSCRGTCYSL